MLSAVLPVVFTLLFLAVLLATWRVLKGPTLADRVVGLDTIYISVIALLITLGISRDTSLYFENGLLIAMIGFVSTCAFAKYLLRGDIVE
jgi:multicomponent K+:H+ antiporter subunit F